MYIVKHNNPKHPSVLRDGEEFAYDGMGENWTKEDAEEFVLRAMYVARKITYEIIELEEEDDDSDTVQPEQNYKEGQRKRRTGTKK